MLEETLARHRHVPAKLGAQATDFEGLGKPRFSGAVPKQATDGLFLDEDWFVTSRKITHSQYGIQLLDALFDRPTFQTSDLVRRTSIPKQTLLPQLKQLRDSGLLIALRESSGRRPAILAFPALLNIAEGHEIL